MFDDPSNGGTTTDAGDSDVNPIADSNVDANPNTDPNANADADADADPVADTGGGTTSEHFSFFVTSYAALRELSGSQAGFGGDLRFGETGAGSGLRGADKICSTIAETSMPGAGKKTWRAFLSATDDGTGRPVHAIDRIGDGPWYDRLGRLFGTSKTDILATRPTSADATIKNDFPNEDGVPNHQPDPTQPAVDNHDMLTGSNTQGHLFSATATCLDWTSALGDVAKEGKPRVGHSWPRSNGGPGGGFGGFPGGPGGTGGPGGEDMNNWMSSLTEAGCKAGVNLIETGGPIAGTVTVGSGGGYGGFYCFALEP